MYTYAAVIMLLLPAMFPKAHTAWSLILACGDAKRFMNIGTAPTRNKPQE